MSTVSTYVWASTEVACEHYGVTLRTLQRWAQKGKVKHRRQGKFSEYSIPAVLETEGPKNVPVVAITSTSENVKDYDNAKIKEAGSVENFLELVQQAKGKAVITEPISIKDKRARKILALSDIHFPFHNETALNQAIEDNLDADVVVLNGDIFDVFGASSYSTNKQRNILVEYNMVLNLVIKLSDLFDEVYLVEGNHERRTDTYFSKKLDPHMYALVDHDIMDRIAKGYIYDEDGKHVGTYKFSNVFYNRPENGNTWVCKVGKTVFIRPSGYSSREMSTIVTAQVHVDNFIGRENYDSVIMGHTHCVGKIVRCGKLLIEQGCLIQVMDYQKKGRATRRPNSLGYAVIYQDEDGNTDFNKSNFIFLGTLNYME